MIALMFALPSGTAYTRASDFLFFSFFIELTTGLVFLFLGWWMTAGNIAAFICMFIWSGLVALALFVSLILGLTVSLRLEANYLMGAVCGSLLRIAFVSFVIARCIGAFGELRLLIKSRREVDPGKSSAAQPSLRDVKPPPPYRESRP